MMHSGDRLNARYRSLIVAAALASSAALTAIAADRITDSSAAIQAAQRYVAGRCTAQTPCKFRAEREGRQWRVWVRLSKRNARGRVVYPSPAKHIVLFFDMNGNLIRRLEAE